MPIRILLADDHTVMRAGLRLLLERQPNLQVIGEAADGRAAVDLAVTQKPDVVVMDIAMPQLNGVEAARQIVNKEPSIAVAILSMHSDESYVIRSLKAGARAYLLKDSAESDLLNAIQAITEGKSFFSPLVRRILKEDYMHQLAEMGAEDTYELLTTREREVLHRIVEGSTSVAIAKELSLSRKTVDTYRARLMVKLGVANRTALIRLAIENELLAH